MSKVKDGREFDEFTDGLIDYSPLDPDGSVDALLLSKRTAQTAIDTATLTAAQILGGILDGTPTSAAAYTLPTVTLLLAGLKNPKVGSSFILLVNNKSSGANTITMTTGTGWTVDGTATVAQNVIRAFLITITSITAATARFDGIA